MRPRLSLIAVISADGFISTGENVPWDLPADRDHFRARTRGKWLLLGRKTYQEMLGWFSDHHPLVLSRDEKFVPFVGERVKDLADALQRATRARQPELIVCGGHGAYAAAMPEADCLIITHVEHLLGGGIPFPAFSQQDWEPVSRQAFSADDLHAYSFVIVTYHRVHHYQHAA